MTRALRIAAELASVALPCAALLAALVGGRPPAGATPEPVRDVETPLRADLTPIVISDWSDPL